MRHREALQLGQARHGAIVVHDFADHRGRRAACHAREVATGLGVPGTHQHAAFYRLNGKDMAGLHNVLRRAFDGHFDGARPVGRRDAGADALRRFNRSGKGRAITRAVAAGHGRQAQLLATLARQRQAHQAAGMGRHEVDGLWRDVLGRQHQIAFIFAVFFVHQNDHFARPQIGHDLLNRRDRRARNRRCWCRRGRDRMGAGRSGHNRQFSVEGGALRAAERKRNAAIIVETAFFGLA